MLFEKIMQVMYNKSPKSLLERTRRENGTYDILASVDHVPTTCAPPTNLARMIVFEDNDAVIKMIKKGRTDKLRHCPRTHRINLDWLFFLLRADKAINIKYINTKHQVADIFTKGLFTKVQYEHLQFLCNITKSQSELLIHRVDECRSICYMC